MLLSVSGHAAGGESAGCATVTSERVWPGSPVRKANAMDISFWGIIGTIVFGAVIGILARLFKRGSQDVSLLVTVVIGVIGALVGYFIWGLIASEGNENTFGIDWIRWAISIVVAILALTVYLGMTGRKSSR